MREKPEVRYMDLGECVIGRPALVWTEEHHTLETKPVVAIAPMLLNGPVFETENTIYLPHPDYKPC